MPTPRRFRRILLVVSSAVVVFAVTASAAERSRSKSKQKAAADDSAPVLMSRTGGGSSWANVKELRAAAEGGNPKAEVQFGEMLLRGDAANGVTQDRARGLAMLEKAARAGESSAAFRIGMLLDDGDGVAQDRTRALAYFKAAAAGGATEAFHNIGAAYASARGVRRDYAEGLAWLIVARQRGADASGEQALRERLQATRRTALIATAEKRAVEIEQELAGKNVADFLPPPAPFGEPTAAAPKQ